MNSYRITISPKPMFYTTFAENEKKAQEYAQDFFFDQTIYDIFDGAKLQIERIDVGVNE